MENESVSEHLKICHICICFYRVLTWHHRLRVRMWTSRFYDGILLKEISEIKDYTIVLEDRGPLTDNGKLWASPGANNKWLHAQRFIPS